MPTVPPNYVTAIAAVLAAIGAALSHVVTGNTNVDTVVAFIAFVLTHLVIPDNTKVLRAQVKQLQDKK